MGSCGQGRQHTDGLIWQRLVNLTNGRPKFFGLTCAEESGYSGLEASLGLFTTTVWQNFKPSVP